MKEFPLVSVIIPTYNRKKKVLRLIESILKSYYPKNKLEIIVVDDASTDGTYEEIKKRFPSIKILRNEEEKLLAGCRNIGIKESTGDFVLLIDDDNIIDKRMITCLVQCIEANPNVGICAPLMLYYKTNTIWCAGIKRNMLTSRTVFLLNGKNFKCVNLPEIIHSDDFPNCFLLRSEIVKKYRLLFDEKNFPMHYDETDFCYRVKNLGYDIVCCTKAMVWHDARRSKVAGFETEWRTHLTARNRVIIHRKYSRLWQFLIFILIFNQLFTLYYLKVILFRSEKPFNERVKIAKSYLKGVFDGILQVSKKNF